MLILHHKLGRNEITILEKIFRTYHIPAELIDISQEPENSVLTDKEKIVAIYDITKGESAFEKAFRNVYGKKVEEYPNIYRVDRPYTALKNGVNQEYLAVFADFAARDEAALKIMEILDRKESVPVVERIIGSRDNLRYVALIGETELEVINRGSRPKRKHWITKDDLAVFFMLREIFKVTKIKVETL